MLHWLYVATEDFKEYTKGQVIEAIPDDGRHCPGKQDVLTDKWAIVKADIDPIQRQEIRLQRFKTDVGKLEPTGKDNEHTGPVALVEREGWAVARMQKLMGRALEKGGRQNELLAQITQDYIAKQAGGVITPAVL